MHRFITPVIALTMTFAPFTATLAADTYPAGTRIIVTQIHPEDSDYDERHDFQCYRAIVPEGEEISTSSSKPGWWRGQVHFLEGPAMASSAKVNPFFVGFKFILDPNPYSSADPVLGDDLSIQVPVLNFHNQSYSANLRFVPNAEGRLLFKVVDYDVKCTNKGQ